MNDSQKPLIQQQLAPAATQAQQTLNAAATVAASQGKAPEPQRKESASLTLSDGRQAVVYRAKGKHLQNAMRQTQDELEMGMIVAASVTTVDGEPLLYEDYLEMDMADCQAILTTYTALMGN